MKRYNYYLISKRERWGLTWKGRLVLLFLAIAIVIVFINNIVPFLGSQKQIEAQVLIIEGYVEDFAYPAIVDEIHKTRPKLIITTGTSYDQGFYITGIPSAAYLIAHSLYAFGIDSCLIHIVPVNPDVLINRSYSSALVSKKYLQKYFQDVTRVNLISTSIHSRRSHYLFRKVFEPEIEVGNIAIQSVYFNHKNWYKSSRSFKAVLTETISWIYVRLFFYPDVDEDIRKVILK